MSKVVVVEDCVAVQIPASDTALKVDSEEGRD
jgi:hypothetical protein